MDPITLNKLLSVGDTLAQRVAQGSVSFASFQALITRHSKAKDPRRRAQEILRVFEDLEWVAIEDAQFNLTAAFRDFVAAWDDGDLLAIGHALAKYAPYAAFLTLLRNDGAIRITGDGKGGSKEFVALDTFRFWAVACGQGHVSPFDESLHWGGDWDYESPLLDSVVSSMRDAYNAVDKTGGFADVGRVADSVCRDLGIAFQAFELKVIALLKRGSVPFTLAPATIRAPSRLFRIATIRKRADICRDRHIADLSGHNQPGLPTHWLEFRYLEDGLRINGDLMKLLKWEAMRDT